MKKVNIKNITKYMPSVIFCVFIFAVMLIFIASPAKTYSPSEKRMLAEKPSINMESVFNGKFGKDFENYLADQIPFRNLFTGINAYYNLFLGQNGSNGVYFCDDGYIINEPVQYDEQLEINVAKIKKFSEFFKENFDISTVVVTVPSTGYIMEKKLPNNHKEYNDGEYLDYINNELNGSAAVVNLTEIFKDKIKESQIYYKTDHHWTTEGTYIAYCEIAPYLNITATSKEDFTVESYSDFYGTTYGSGCYWLSASDNIELWVNKNHQENTVNVTIPENGISVNNSVFFRENVVGDDKYTVFIDGNHGYVKIINNDVKDGALIVVRDSFGHSMSQFISDNYHEVILIDLRYYKSSIIDIVEEVINTDKLEIKNILLLYGIDSMVTDVDISSMITNSQIKQWEASNLQ